MKLKSMISIYLTCNNRFCCCTGKNSKIANKYIGTVEGHFEKKEEVFQEKAK